MKRVISAGMICLLTVTTAAAQTAQLTANVNFRTGPGSSHESMGVLNQGTTVDLLNCNDAGSWCAVEADGQNGFVSGKYLVLSPDQDGSGATTDGSVWPRAFSLGDGAFIVLYEPQFSDWVGFRTLEAVIAAEYHANETADPIFGVIGMRTTSARDATTGTVVLSGLELTQVDFAALGRAEIEKLSLGVGKLLPTGPVTIGEERIVASLANYKQMNDIDGLKAIAPTIFVATSPARLVQTDGEAIFAPVQGAVGVEFVVNTNWDLLRVDGALWMRDETSWLTAADLNGPWTMTMDLPAALGALPEDGNWDDARAAMPPIAYDEGAPQIFYSDAAAELLSFNGDPAFDDVPGGNLQWASNSESDLFRMKPDGPYYYLVSGRWFSADALDGPWAFATPTLPVDFQNIPDNVPYYTVRASIPNTSEANEARLRASIPETARVSRADITPPEISYDGEPEFAPIDGTSLEMATNTQAQVIKVQNTYYLVYDGVWFTSDSAEGPWQLATDIPDEIYTIPASSEAHNVTYVTVYDTSPTHVTYGYSSGYMFGLLAWGVLVYGNGWYYPPYYRPWPGRPPIYYPRPISYGAGAYYNPARGSFGRYGYAYGPYRGIQARSSWNPKTGTYARGARVSGPGGSRGFVSAYNPRTGNRAVAKGGSNVYGKWGSGAVTNGSDYLRASGRSNTDGGKGIKWDSSKGSGFAANGRRGNTYAGRDGNVYRNTGDSWQKWDPGNGWEGVDPPRKEALTREKGSLSDRAQTGNLTRDRANTQLGNRPQTGVPSLSNLPQAGTGGLTNLPQGSRPNRPSTGAARVPDHVSRDAASRNRANQRSIEQRYSAPKASQSRPATAQSPNRTPSSMHRSGGARAGSGGARAGGRGGGGRRR